MDLRVFYAHANAEETGSYMARRQRANRDAGSKNQDQGIENGKEHWDI